MTSVFGMIGTLLRSLAQVLWAVLAALWPSQATRRRALRVFRASPPALRVAILCVVAGLGWLGGNWMYQVVRKPAELFFPFDGAFAKDPHELWRSYRSSFVSNSTVIIDAPFLAALAHLESAGDPVARTYWRWQWSWNPLRWYSPASSAVGMYQLTDGTFREMQRFCIHQHEVVEEGPWYDANSCWFNALYLRALPGDAIEMTSAYLDRQVRAIQASTRRPQATAAQQRDLAAVIHLCGSGVARGYAERGFRALPGQLCGSHSIADYLRRLRSLRAKFRELAGDAER